jgi:hypothetical protein
VIPLIFLRNVIYLIAKVSQRDFRRKRFDGIF